MKQVNTDDSLIPDVYAPYNHQKFELKPLEIVEKNLLLPTEHVEGFAEEIEVNFRWGEVSKDSVYKLQVSLSREFSGDMVEFNVKDNHAVVSFSQSGEYFWRVTASEGIKSGVSETGSFIVKRERDPEPEADDVPFTNTYLPLRPESAENHK